VKYVALGVVATIFFYTLFRALRLRLYGARTTGTVTGLRRDDSGDGPVFHPLVRFTTHTGVSVEVESGFGMSNGVDFFYVGRQVDILYLPRNPRVFTIVGYESETILYLMLGAAFVGGVFYWISTVQ
jgi:hypothetical protein